MAEFTRELFLKALDEWGRYVETFRDLPEAEQASFLKAQGYASARELLAHVAVWWEEARGIIDETIKKGEGPGRKYDFAVFNAAAIKRFQDTPEAEFMAWYESERQRMSGVASGLSESQLQVRRIRNWLNAVLLEHLKEHGCRRAAFPCHRYAPSRMGRLRQGLCRPHRGRAGSLSKEAGIRSLPGCACSRRGMVGAWALV